MDRLREVLETAIEAHWREPVYPEAIAGHDARILPRPRKGSLTRVASALEARLPGVRKVVVENEMLKRNRLVAALPGSAEREAFCLLQAAVARRLGRDLRVIGVTGPRSGHGKTLAAVNLAISLSLDGNRNVVIVDLDIQAPTVHKLFGVDVTLAVQDCLFKGIAWPEASFSPLLERLAVLPARSGSRSPKQILRSPNLKALLDSIRTDTADCIAIVDLPAVASRGDGAVLESLVDAVLLVVEDGATREADYRRALQSFSKQKLLGTVLNKVEAPE